MPPPEDQLPDDWMPPAFSAYLSRQRVIVAANGTVVEVGGVYLTFSGDYERPYAVAKVVSVGSGSALDGHVTPDLVPVSSPDLWLKLYHANLAERPDGVSPALVAEGYRIILVSVSAFLAWGPPRFPGRLGTEAVSAEELAERVPEN